MQRSAFDSTTVQRSALCRSRRELSNEYLLAKIGVDTAENEPLEVWGKIIQYFLFVSLTQVMERPRSERPERPSDQKRPSSRGPGAERPTEERKEEKRDRDRDRDRRPADRRDQRSATALAASSAAPSDRGGAAQRR